MSERLQRRYAWRRIGKDNVGHERDQFSRVSVYVLRVFLAPADVESDIDTVGPAGLLQNHLKCRETGLTLLIAGWPVKEYCNPPDSVGWLRMCGERPNGSSAAEKRHELASPHCLVLKVEDRSLPYRGRQQYCAAHHRAAHVRSGSKADIRPTKA